MTKKNVLLHTFWYRNFRILTASSWCWAYIFFSTQNFLRCFFFGILNLIFIHIKHLKKKYNKLSVTAMVGISFSDFSVISINFFRFSEFISKGWKSWHNWGILLFLWSSNKKKKYKNFYRMNKKIKKRIMNKFDASRILFSLWNTFYFLKFWS